MKKFISNFLPFGIVITLLSGVIYGAMQHEIRMAANNPQIEAVEDTVNLVKGGLSPGNLFASRPVDIEKRLSTFLVIYDNQGRVLGSNALLDNKPPVIPIGVLDFARAKGENRVTWEPKPGVRIAAVVQPYVIESASSSAGFVLAGRSLREVEKRSKDLILEIVFGWLVTMVLTGAAVYSQNRRREIAPAA